LPGSAKIETRREEGESMRVKEKEKLQRKLDKEMQPFRRAAKDENQTRGLLRAIRNALQIPAREIAKGMGVNRSGVFELEARELKGTASLLSISRMAETMGCKVVYGIVPWYGKTLEQLMEAREWRKELDSDQ